MAIIRPSADLRNSYNEISKICHETKEPVYITKNGYNDLVILSNDAFEKYEQERIEKAVEKQFEEKYPDFESFKRDVYSKIEEARKEIMEGKGILMEDAVGEMEAEYYINEKI